MLVLLGGIWRAVLLALARDAYVTLCELRERLPRQLCLQDRQLQSALLAAYLSRFLLVLVVNGRLWHDGLPVRIGGSRALLL